MYFQVFIIALLAGMSPGPDFLIVTRNSLRYGRKVGISSSIGIAAALGIHATYTILGIAIIIKHYYFLYLLIQIFGAIYIAYLGIKTIVSTFSKKTDDFSINDSSYINKNMHQGFLNGFLCNIMNPKAFVFFLSIFSQFITQDTNNRIAIIYGSEVVITIGLWFTVLSILISSDKIRELYGKFSKWLERLFGVILIYFSVNIIKNALE